MLRIRPALAIVLGGVLSGALVAQAVPTDPKGQSPRPWTQTAPDDYPEIVGITYETIPGAASDPYNFTPHRPTWRQASLADDQLGDIPGYSEPDYSEDSGSDYTDPQVPEDVDVTPVDRDEVAVLPPEIEPQPVAINLIG